MPWIQDDIAGFKGKGLYTGETILHMAIVNGDVKFVRYLLDMGADVNAKAVGEFFMPMVTRRGHVDKKPESFWARAWDACLTLLHIHDVDDRVGDANRESGFEGQDLYFGQLPLSFVACTGQVEICDELKDSLDSYFSRIKVNPTGIRPPLTFSSLIYVL